MRLFNLEWTVWHLDVQKGCGMRAQKYSDAKNGKTKQLVAFNLRKTESSVSLIKPQKWIALWKAKIHSIVLQTSFPNSFVLLWNCADPFLWKSRVHVSCAWKISRFYDRTKSFCEEINRQSPNAAHNHALSVKAGKNTTHSLPSDRNTPSSSSPTLPLVLQQEEEKENEEKRKPERAISELSAQSHGNRAMEATSVQPADEQSGSAIGGGTLAPPPPPPFKNLLEGEVSVNRITVTSRLTSPWFQGAAPPQLAAVTEADWRGGGYRQLPARGIGLVSATGGTRRRCCRVPRPRGYSWSFAAFLGQWPSGWRLAAQSWSWRNRIPQKGRCRQPPGCAARLRRRLSTSLVLWWRICRSSLPCGGLAVKGRTKTRWTHGNQRANQWDAHMQCTKRAKKLKEKTKNWISEWSFGCCF